MKNFARPLIASLLLSALSAYGAAREWRVPTYVHSYNYTVRDGLPSNHVYGIVQDSVGFIWIGTSNGLCRFDGQSFCNYLHDGSDRTSISSNNIRRLMIDRRQQIWISLDNGVDIYDTATDKLRLSAEAEGDITHVTVRLDASKAYVGFQMDLKLPAGVTLLNESLGGCATDHNLHSNTLADGTHRIIISSLQNSEFNASGDALVHLEVSGRNANRITAASVMATDASGMLYSIIGDGADGTTGIDGVNAEKSLKEKIYSVGGQVMDTLKKGINIIRNADGSTKKVIKK